jgi:acyl-CoA thioester hydrolase
MKTHDARFRVRYAETDQMGVVYYANYLVWMEVGRVEYCRSLGFNYRDMEKEDGIGLAVAEANCRYLFPARYDEEIVVKTGVSEAGPRMIQFSYQIENAANGKTLASGFTKHVFVGPDMRPCKLPPKYRARFGIK